VIPLKADACEIVPRVLYAATGCGESSPSAFMPIIDKNEHALTSYGNRIHSR